MFDWGNQTRTQIEGPHLFNDKYSERDPFPNPSLKKNRGDWPRKKPPKSQ